MFYIVGLGNPGEKYKDNRHNAGKMIVDYFQSKNSNIKTQNLNIIKSLEFMNNSGKAVAKYVKSKKAAEKLIVVHDDLDLPIGTMKISYNKSSGGHKGLESIIKALKTKEFTRIRIGIATTTPKGKIKKPGSDLPHRQASKKILDFILGKFKPSELEILKKVFKKSSEAIQILISEGRDKAMNLYN